MFLNFPALAAATLSGRLDRAQQLTAAAIAGTAAGYMQDRPPAPIDRCLQIPSCTRGGYVTVPLCAACAIDNAVLRHARPRPAGRVAELHDCGVTVRQAVLDIAGANPESGVPNPDREALMMISMRLHTGDLEPMTADEQREIVMRGRCLNAVNGAGYRGRLRTTDPAVLADLETRGWAIGGYVTAAGTHAADNARRDARNHARNRTR